MVHEAKDRFMSRPETISGRLKRVSKGLKAPKGLTVASHLSCGTSTFDMWLEGRESVTLLHMQIGLFLRA